MAAPCTPEGLVSHLGRMTADCSTRWLGERDHSYGIEYWIRKDQA